MTYRRFVSHSQSVKVNANCEFSSRILPALLARSAVIQTVLTSEPGTGAGGSGLAEGEPACTRALCIFTPCITV